MRYQHYSESFSEQDGILEDVVQDHFQPKTNVPPSNANPASQRRPFDSLHETSRTGGAPSIPPDDVLYRPRLQSGGIVQLTASGVTSQQQQQQQQQSVGTHSNYASASQCSTNVATAPTQASPEKAVTTASTLDTSLTDEYQRRMTTNYLRSEYLVNEGIIQEQLHFVEFLRQLRNLIEIHARYSLEVSQCLYEKLTFLVIKHAYLHLIWIKNRLLERTENILNLSEWQTFKVSDSYLRACSAVISTFYDVSQMLESFMNNLQIVPHYSTLFSDALFARLFSIDAFAAAGGGDASAARFPTQFFDALILYVRSFIKEADHRLNLIFKRRHRPAKDAHSAYLNGSAMSAVSSASSTSSSAAALAKNPILTKDEQLAVETLATFVDYHAVLVDLVNKQSLNDYYSYFDRKRSFLERKKVILEYAQYLKLRQHIHELDLVSNVVKL